MKPFLSYLILIFTIVFAFTGCKKKSSDSVNPSNIYYTRMATMRHWHGTESVVSPSGSYVDSVIDSFAVQVINYENIVVYGRQLALVDSNNNYLEFQAGTDLAVSTFIYYKTADKMTYDYFQHVGMQSSDDLNLTSD